MKKRYFSFIAIVLVSAMFLLTTGCGVKVNGKEYELFKSDKSDVKNIFVSFGDEITNTQNISQDVKESDSLKVSTNAGNIDIVGQSGSNITVQAEIKVRGTSEKEKKSIMDNVVISVDSNGKALEIVAKTKDGKDFWDWQKGNFKVYQVSINYTINLPENIKVLDANTGAGNIDIENSKSQLSLVTGAGNIDIENAAVKGNTNMHTGAGNIDVENTSISGETKMHSGAGNIDFDGSFNDVSAFEADTGVGNIGFKVDEQTKMSLEAKSGIGILSGSFIDTSDDSKFSFKGDINGGGPSVNLRTGVGNIDADKK